METSPLGILMIVGMSSGYIGGIALAIFLARKLINPHSSQRAAYIAGLSACYLSVIPAAFIATIFGGTPGGGLGELLFGKYGVPFGLALGLACVIVVVVVCASTLGLVIGRVVHELYVKSAAT